MAWAALAAAAASAISASQQDSGPSGAPAPAIPNGPVTVSVGGLNVPAYPNFPRMEMGGGQVVSQPDAAQTLASEGGVYLLAGAVVLAVFLSKVLK